MISLYGDKVKKGDKKTGHPGGCLFLISESQIFYSQFGKLRITDCAQMCKPIRLTTDYSFKQIAYSTCVPEMFLSIITHHCHLVPKQCNCII